MKEERCKKCELPIVQNQYTGWWESEEWLTVCTPENGMIEGSRHIPDIPGAPEPSLRDTPAMPLTGNPFWELAERLRREREAQAAQ